MYSVYLIRNKTDGKIYIGATGQKLNLRWNVHKSSGRIDWPLYQDIKKYGEQSFYLKILQCFKKREEAFKFEKLCIKKYNCLFPNGYNRTIGGMGTNGYQYTKEQRKAHSENMKIKMNTDQAHLNQSNASKEKWSKKSYRQKVVFSLKKVRSDPEYRKQQKIRSRRAWSNPELLKRHSDKMKEVWKNPEYRKNQSEWLKKNHPLAKHIKVDGIAYPSIVEASRQLEINWNTLKKRLRERFPGYEYN